MKTISYVKNIIDEVEKNEEKINVLDDKIKILNLNTIKEKINMVINKSSIPYFILVISSVIGLSIFNIGLCAQLIPLIIVGLSTSFGIIKSKEERKKNKDKLKLFSNSKTEKEIIEEKMAYNLEKEKLQTKNKYLNGVLFKNINTDNIENINDYNTTEQLFNKENDELDKLITKRFIDKNYNFSRIRKRSFNKLYCILNTLVCACFSCISLIFPMTISVMITGPLIHYVYSIVNNWIIGLIITIPIGAILSYNDSKNYKEIFKNMNNELGSDALSESIDDKNDYYEKYDEYEEKIENKINNLIEIKGKLEEEKTKLVESKKDNYDFQASNLKSNIVNIGDNNEKSFDVFEENKYPNSENKKILEYTMKPDKNF